MQAMEKLLFLDTEFDEINICIIFIVIYSATKDDHHKKQKSLIMPVLAGRLGMI
jgi:hypothetical protein